MSRLRVDEEQREPALRPWRDCVRTAEVPGDALRQGRGERLAVAGVSGLEGEAHDRDAVAEALGLLDLEVDEKAKERLVDKPSPTGERTQITRFAQNEVPGTRRATEQ